MPDYLGDFDGHDPIAPSIQFLGQLPLNRRVRLPVVAVFALVHGGAGTAALWDGVADDLSRLGHEAIAMDLSERLCP
jgi:alpha-beta hydrolase superfamily lysophospholipase